MTLLLARLKQFRLDIFNKNIVTLDLEARDPDDACYLVFKMLCDTVLNQDKSIETKLLLKDIKNDFKVIQLRESQ